jgi:HK97 gp10 family phage protein
MARPSRQLARLQERLDAIPKSVREAVQPALVKSGAELVATMRQLAPEDTGALKDSIVATLPGDRTPPYSQPGGARIVGDTEVVVTAGNSGVRYPHLVEYGTAEAAAQPFFWTAFRLLKRRMENRIKRAVGKAVRDGWKAS